MRSNASVRPSESGSESANLPRSSMVLKMPNAGGQVPAMMVAPASASDLAMAKPKPPSSATPATSARFPRRSMASMARTIDRARAAVKLERASLVIEEQHRRLGHATASQALQNYHAPGTKCTQQAPQPSLLARRAIEELHAEGAVALARAAVAHFAGDDE